MLVVAVAAAVEVEEAAAVEAVAVEGEVATMAVDMAEGEGEGTEEVDATGGELKRSISVIRHILHNLSRFGRLIDQPNITLDLVHHQHHPGDVQTRKAKSGCRGHTAQCILLTTKSGQDSSPGCRFIPAAWPIVQSRGP